MNLEIFLDDAPAGCSDDDEADEQDAVEGEVCFSGPGSFGADAGGAPGRGEGEGHYGETSGEMDRMTQVSKFTEGADDADRKEQQHQGDENAAKCKVNRSQPGGTVYSLISGIKQAAAAEREQSVCAE